MDFFDTHKLKHAFAEVNDALVGGHRGLAAYDYGVVSPEGAVLHTPAAGWNVCSKDKSEFGFFETVCIFDGDISVDGLPCVLSQFALGSPPPPSPSPAPSPGTAPRSWTSRRPTSAG